MPITSRQLLSFCKEVKEKRAEANAPPPPEMPGALKFGPLEQALMVLIIIGMVSDPAATGVPSLLTPGVTMLLIIAYGGYRLLEWQKEAEKRAREQPEKPTESKSASSLAREKEKAAKERETPKANGTQITTKADLLKEQDRLKDKSSKTSKDVRAATKKTQYFLTMNGPGRPALVPFPRGFKAADDSPDGTLWWNNVDNLDIKDMMVPQGPPAKSSREERKEKEASKHVQPPGTLSAEEIRARAPMEQEMERYEKVMVIMQCILALLLCFIDQRLGLGLLALFLFFHFRSEKEKEKFRQRNIAALPPGTKNPYDEGPGSYEGGASFE
ncbi:hypothetical protein FFLO_04976 [Filobasidium floriforme]|uniref:Uncharacterized protein n=1 Tax=Filobasidium floriforme TaxID=5210 RepID=A0A8K0JHW4_9TREE|nr:uncharacterized protein HD553DRAFT_118698 [Filobasidium floriforme]KAG7530550.1 hypothetical protein FFLO_04976 [Filobasidium floriforme]KAH8080089.1 hypothetical protein HD553DRAFT_118698 [Filobasidium floriforme]